MTQTAIVHCTFDIDLESGKTMSRGAVDPTAKINGEHITFSLRRTTMDLRRGKWYRVDVTEIDPPGTLPV